MFQKIRDNSFIAEYYLYQHCLNIEQGVNLWHLLNRVLLMNIPGDVVEIGSLTGMTSAVIQKTIDSAGADKKLYLYDSFEGLSNLTAEDSGCCLKPENFKTDKQHTIDRFDKLGLKQPIIVAGWVNETLPAQLPDTISFAHIDLDLYAPTLHSLECIYDRLSANAVVLVDDYIDDVFFEKVGKLYTDNPYSKARMVVYNNKGNFIPGVKKAVDEFLVNKPESLEMLIARDENHAHFIKI